MFRLCMQKNFHVLKLTCLDTMYNKSYTRRSLSKMCKHWKSERKKCTFSISFLLQPTFQPFQTIVPRVSYMNHYHNTAAFNHRVDTSKRRFRSSNNFPHFYIQCRWWMDISGRHKLWKQSTPSKSYRKLLEFGAVRTFRRT